MLGGRKYLQSVGSTTRVSGLHSGCACNDTVAAFKELFVMCPMCNGL